MENRQRLVAGEITTNSQAYEILTILCDRFESRFFSTPEEEGAARFISDKLSEYGLSNIVVEPCSFFGWMNGELTSLWSWTRGTASLKILAPFKRKLPCISWANIPSTSDHGVTGEIFNLGDGTRQYILEHREEIRGKIVLDGNYSLPGTYLMDPSVLRQQTVYGYLVQFGAVGVIFANNNYGMLPVTGPARYGSIGEIPACGIARESSCFLLRQMSKGVVKANLKTRNSYKPDAITYNVIAELPGTVYTDEVILVGGHYDGHDISAGAMDNAAGICVMLEAARALAKYGGATKRTIRFCCFGGEELGLNGSTGYVLNHRNDLDNVKLMINTDASGISAQSGHGFVVYGPKELVCYLEEVAERLSSFDRKWELPGTSHSVSPYSGQHSLSPYSDHWPFFMLGVPTAHFHDIPANPIDLLYSHTSADTLDKVDYKGLKDAALVLALFLIQIANDEHIPIKHTPVMKVIEHLEKEEIAENLRVEKRWLRETQDSIRRHL